MANLTMSLKESGQYDLKNGARNKLTGWGIICKDRRERGISRKQVRLKKRQEVK